MPKFNTVPLLIVLSLGLLTSTYLAFNFHADSKVAQEKLKDIEVAMSLQKALSESMSNISVNAIKQKADSENEKTTTKYVVRNIVQASECSNVDIPLDAVNQLREYADSIRGTTSAN